jgi:hypothetical protein
VIRFRVDGQALSDLLSKNTVEFFKSVCAPHRAATDACAHAPQLTMRSLLPPLRAAKPFAPHGSPLRKQTARDGAHPHESVSLT